MHGCILYVDISTPALKPYSLCATRPPPPPPPGIVAAATVGAPPDIAGDKKGKNNLAKALRRYSDNTGSWLFCSAYNGVGKAFVHLNLPNHQGWLKETSSQ